MAGETGEIRHDPDGTRHDLVPQPEATVSHQEVEDFMGGPGVVSTPGMWKGWTRGVLVGGVGGGVLGAVIGIVAVAASGASWWWVVAAAAIGVFCGATIGFVLGGSFGTLEYDQGRRRAEEDDGGPITRPPVGPSITRRGGSGRLGPSH
jgi:hypothetical protein